MALKVPEPLTEISPPFCSHILFEFYENNAEEEMIRILFNKIPVKIDGATSTIISKSEMLELTSWVRRTSDQHTHDLKNYKPDFEKIFVDLINTHFE